MIIASSHSAPVPLESLSIELREQLIVYGALLELDDAAPAGVAVAVQGPDRQAAESLLEEGRAGLTAFPSIEIHDWEFGGRR